MTKMRGTSNVPMILGIIGGVLGIPGAVCAGACSAGIASVATNVDKAGEIGNFYMVTGLIGAILGLVFGILAKRFPVISGIIMIIAALMAGITLIAGNFIALIVIVLFLIGGIMSLTQKKVEAV